MRTREKIILETKAWAEEMNQLDHDSFDRLSRMHNPNILWICSSDSLIPIREVTNTDPGEIMVYRNVANQINPEDTSLMAVIEDALTQGQLEMIVVCGYSHCSGIRAVLQGFNDKPNMHRWLHGLRRIYDEHASEFAPLSMAQKEKQLSILNIHRQIENLASLEAVKKSWSQHRRPQLLGWYFDLPTGTFSEIAHVDPPDRD